MRIPTIALAIAGLTVAAAPVLAATAPAVKAAPAASQAQVQNAELYLKVLISALQSDKVPGPLKGTLVGCIYNNSLGKISDSMDKVIAQNAAKIHRDKPDELLAAMAAICGYKPVAGAKPAAPATGSGTSGR